MFARTKRLTLRPGWAEDAVDIAQAIGHESVVTKLARPPWPYGVNEAQAFLAQPRGAHDPQFIILEHGAASPVLVGGIGITTDPDGARMLGYWLAPDAWGRGLATEAGRAVIDIARHAIGLRQLHAWHFLDNPASGQVLRKLGFHPTGRVELRPSRARGGVAPSAAFNLDLDEDRGRGEQRMAA